MGFHSLVGEGQWEEEWTGRVGEGRVGEGRVGEVNGEGRVREGRVGKEWVGVRVRSKLAYMVDWFEVIEGRYRVRAVLGQGLGLGQGQGHYLRGALRLPMVAIYPEKPPITSLVAV